MCIRDRVVVWPRLSGQGEMGIELLAPADPTEPYPAARPEWFMLWLFQFLKFFPGGTEAIGSVIIPGVVLLLLAILPWTGRWRLGAVFHDPLLAIGLEGAGVLPWCAGARGTRGPCFGVGGYDRFTVSGYDRFTVDNSLIHRVYQQFCG